MKFTKRSVEIEAEEFSASNIDNVAKFVGNKGSIVADSSGKTLEPLKMVIHTLEGDMTASEGDYIIKGVNGEFYPCKPDIFSKTYYKTDTFLDRMLVERTELQSKENKLFAFFGTDKYKGLSKKDQSLLHKQFGAMLSYESVLIERINIVKNLVER